MATIYALRNKTNQHVYIGCTKGRPAKRMREHRCLLNKGKHTSPKLQDDWLIFGPDEFEMCILEIIPNATLEQRRQAELRYMRENAGRLYNANPDSFAPTKDAIRKGIEASKGVIGNRWSAEANEKRRLAQLGKPKGHGAKISATKRAKQAMR